MTTDNALTHVSTAADFAARALMGYDLLCESIAHAADEGGEPPADMLARQTFPGGPTVSELAARISGDALRIGLVADQVLGARPGIYDECGPFAHPVATACYRVAASAHYLGDPAWWQTEDTGVPLTPDDFAPMLDSPEFRAFWATHRMTDENEEYVWETYERLELDPPEFCDA